MNNYLRITLGILVTLNAEAASSPTTKVVDESKRPLGCKDIGYKFEYNALELLPETEGDHNAMYFIYNRSNKPVRLYQMRGEESVRSLYLNHTINPKQWAVLSTNESKLKYICADAEKMPYGNVTDCAQTIQVCEYVRVKFGLNNRGSFWLVKGNTGKGAVAEVLHYGIIPR